MLYNYCTRYISHNLHVTQIYIFVNIISLILVLCLNIHKDGFFKKIPLEFHLLEITTVGIRQKAPPKIKISPTNCSQDIFNFQMKIE